MQNMGLSQNDVIVVEKVGKSEEEKKMLRVLFNGGYMNHWC